MVEQQYHVVLMRILSFPPPQKQGSPHEPPMHDAACPVDPDPNPTPPNIYASGLHDTAAEEPDGKS